MQAEKCTLEFTVLIEIDVASLLYFKFSFKLSNKFCESKEIELPVSRRNIISLLFKEALIRGNGGTLC